MRYSSVVIPFAVAVAAACHDGPTGPDVSELLRSGSNGAAALTATQTAQGLWEHRTEYDWTAQRAVQEIHVGSDMHLISERDRVQILPGETVWITFRVDAQRRVASEATVKGVRGQTCVTNSGAARVDGVSIHEQVERKTGASWVAVGGLSTVISSTAALDKAGSMCLPYEILFDAESGAEYRVVATLTANRGGTAATSASFALPSDKRAVEIDAEASVRDAWFNACRETFGLDFSCMSPDTSPQDRLLKANATGHASVSFMVDVRNDGVCPDTFVFTIDEPLRESGPAPAGGEIRSVNSGSLLITTGQCDDGCPKSAADWAALFQSNPQEASARLPIALGIAHGEKTVGVANQELARGVFNRFGDATNGIHELYAQLFAAKLNISAGVDPRPIRDVRIAVDLFLSEHHATEWATLTTQQRALVAEWIAALKAFNERECDSGSAGCTRTIGYWKNHAGFGPQNDEVTPLLPIWLGTAGGSRSIQVTSAALAVELLNKSGDASNGINKLYAQLLGAKLNIKHGADGSAIAQAIAEADAFLAIHDSAHWDSLSSSDRQRVLALAAMFDDYNNGKIGPGHCD